MTVIYLQTTEMKHAVEDYPEVMLLDATYGTNNRKMPLLPVMVVNGHGTGLVVAQALVCNEKRETILTFLDVYQENNTAAKSAQVFLTDKAFNEFILIRKMLPDAAVMYCLFHVMQTFKKKVHSLYMQPENKESLMQTLVKITHSQSEDDYDQLVDRMKVVALTEFMVYYRENWGNCANM